MKDFFRVYYSLTGTDETSVPFRTENEAKAFAKGLRHAEDAINEHKDKTERASKAARL